MGPRGKGRREAPPGGTKRKLPDEVRVYHGKERNAKDANTRTMGCPPTRVCEEVGRRGPRDNTATKTENEKKKKEEHDGNKPKRKKGPTWGRPFLVP